MSSEVASGNAFPLQFEEISDVLTIMREKEEGIYRRQFEPNELEALWRKILIDWMAFVVDHCNLQRQAVAAAAFFLDVAMEKGLIVTREEHQLAAASCLQLALKLFDSTVIHIEKLVKLGRGLFTEDDLGTMELKILRAMNWQCHPPSTHCFLRQYERLLPSGVSDSTRDMIDEVTKLVCELTVVDHKYNSYPPSIVAYGAMLMAMELLEPTDLPIQHRQCFVVRMSTVSQLESNSTEVLKVFEDLKETLDASSKLGDLMQSLASVRNERAKPISHGNGSKAATDSSKLESPRHVMARLGSHSSRSLSSQGSH